MLLTVELQNERVLLEPDYKGDLVSRPYSHLVVLMGDETIWIGYGNGEAERKTGYTARLCERANEWREHLESLGVEGRELNEPVVWLLGTLAGGPGMSESHLEFFRAGKVHPVCG